MFTGLIESTANVVSNVAHKTGLKLVVESPWQDIIVGESIAVNGVCLTVVAFSEGTLCFDVSHETLSCTALGTLGSRTLVNLERAVTGATRLGGHYVTGHVDTTFEVIALQEEGEYLKIDLHAPRATHALLPPKGSLTLDGVSLTINALDDKAECLSLLVIPHTRAHTNLAVLKEKQQVNIEFDYLAKMIVHQLQHLSRLESCAQNDAHAINPTLSEVSVV